MSLTGRGQASASTQIFITVTGCRASRISMPAAGATSRFGWRKAWLCYSRRTARSRGLRLTIARYRYEASREKEACNEEAGREEGGREEGGREEEGREEGRGGRVRD